MMHYEAYFLQKDQKKPQKPKETKKQRKEGEESALSTLFDEEKPKIQEKEEMEYSQPSWDTTKGKHYDVLYFFPVF